MAMLTDRLIRYIFLSCLLVSFLIMFSCKQEQKELTGYKYTNALINETSPYLLQHAHNPVDWRPWSQEALEEARESNKLVLVSIGYSSCHWCHVMEEETFEDEAIAKMMNENFVNIKVDREERPDVDHIYMTALQLLKGRGGWPLNVIILPNGKPIYGGTYHTKEQWNQVLTEVSNKYKEDPEKANEYADMVANGIAEVNIIKPNDDFENLNSRVIGESVENWMPYWDLEWGGNQGTQKFMLPANLSFQLDYALLTANDSVLAHVKNTIDKMALGGIYDHIGGGFFRYSTDSRWKVPHFEKMLYDNAQLISLYSKAYKVFREPIYKDIVMGTIAFLEREMKNPEGGYYAALDADSEGEEGKYYVWNQEELKSVLKGEYALFSSYFQLNPADVWENGNYVLFKSMDDQDFMEQNKVSMSDLVKKKTDWNKVLLKTRQKRIRPNTDDKIITSWNALLISGLVDAYTSFGNKEFLNRAEGIYEFISEKSYYKNQLIHSYKKGGKAMEGFLEDYAFLTSATLKLYGITMKSKYLKFAQELNQKVETEFNDPSSGMFRYNKGDELITKIIKTDDGVLPSPNAIMADNLFTLGHISYDIKAINRSKIMLSSMVPLLRDNADSYSVWNSLFLKVAYPYFEIAIVGENASSFIQELNGMYIPNILVVGSASESNLPLFKYRYVEGETFVYVCQDSACKFPVATIKDALAQLQNF